jgi:hypothetical protein
MIWRRHPHPDEQRFVSCRARMIRKISVNVQRNSWSVGARSIAPELPPGITDRLRDTTAAVSDKTAAPKCSKIVISTVHHINAQLLLSQVNIGA